MSFQSLEDILQGAASPVELLRNSQIGPYAFPVVRHEFTNWRDEQRSWRETCASGDAGNGGALEAILIKHLDCCSEQALERFAATRLMGGENGLGHGIILQKSLT